MRHYFLKIVLLSGIIPLAGCADPNERANQLYVEASQLMENAKTAEQESYSKAFELYENARNKIERITSEYVTTNIAVELTSGQTKISGLTLGEFQGLESHLKPFAEAEQNPKLFPSPSLVAAISSQSIGKAELLAEIAGKYTEMGQLETAAKLLSQVREFVVAHRSEITEIATKEGLLRRAQLIARYVKLYVEVGQKESATILLSRALKTIKDDDYYQLYKAEDLAEIGKTYAEIGHKETATELLSEALELTGAIDYKRIMDVGHLGSKIRALIIKNQSLIEISGLYVELGQKEAATELLSQVLGTTGAINGWPSNQWPSNQGRQLAEIAEIYADAGQKETATKLLSEALEITGAIGGRTTYFNRARNLVAIAEICAEAGQKEPAAKLLSEALEITETDEEYLVDIIIGFTKAGQQPSKKDFGKIFAMIRATNKITPM